MKARNVLGCCVVLAAFATGARAQSSVSMLTLKKTESPANSGQYIINADGKITIDAADMFNGSKFYIVDPNGTTQYLGFMNPGGPTPGNTVTWTGNYNPLTGAGRYTVKVEIQTIKNGTITRYSANTTITLP